MFGGIPGENGTRSRDRRKTAELTTETKPGILSYFYFIIGVETEEVVTHFLCLYFDVCIFYNDNVGAVIDRPRAIDNRPYKSYGRFFTFCNALLSIRSLIIPNPAQTIRLRRRYG